jgi:hypothetical protein
LCALAEPVDNQCAITILQHPRERHHPIGTARLVRLALRRAEVVVCWQLLAPPSLSRRVDARWGVLFPSPHAVDVGHFAGMSQQNPPMTLPQDEHDAGAPAQKPEHLIVLDGTWSHARSLYRNNPWLWTLPHYRITPEGQDRYRIRREPKAEYTSTLEAIITALMRLEPQTQGLAGVLSAFDTMIDRQIACIKTRHQGARRRLRPRSRPHSRGVPQALLDHPERTIVVFVEFMQHTQGDKTSREMVYLTAEHLQTGRTFAQFVRPQGPGPSSRHLGHMCLSADDVAKDAVPLDTLVLRWNAFAGPSPHLLAWNQASLDLMAQLDTKSSPMWLLKAMFAVAHRQRGGTLGDAVQKAQLEARPAQAMGRAAMRLGSAVAVARFLIDRAHNQVGSAAS